MLVDEGKSEIIRGLIPKNSLHLLPHNPEYENAVEEAVCAVEAAAKNLFPQAKDKTLTDIVKHIAGNKSGESLHKIALTVTGLYGFRGAGKGVSHGEANGGEVTKYLAEYSLAAAPFQIILFHELASAQEDNVPF